ncbi:MAG TPA: SpoIID/LytB domain-containing protein, partial [Candidatus Xenobia bacterium]
MIAWFLALLWLLPRPVAGPALENVAVLRSQPSLKYSGWVGRWQLDSCVSTLRTLGLHPEVVGADELLGVHARLLVLANTRCMSAVEVDAVRAFYRRGGAILATYLSSYRNEKNQAVGAGNHFQLADLLGCDVYSWASGPGVCSVLKPMHRPGIELGRNTAMLVRPTGGAVLATWEGQPDVSSAAVVMRPRVIYVGEDLFVPDNCGSGQVKRYLASLLDRLGVHRRPVAGWDKTVEHLDVPFPAGAPVPPATGPEIRVGLDDVPALSTDQAEVVGTFVQVQRRGHWVEVPSVRLPQVTRIEYLSTVLRQPMLVGYAGHRQAFRARSPVTLRPVGHSYLVLAGRHANGTGALRAYRGEMVVDGRASGLGLVNVLPLESYTAGVVPNEMGPLFPPQALAAMAVVARTFALSHLRRHEDQGYDVCATVHCQVYGGMLSEWESTNQAVAETQGVVAYSGDRPADTTFHACCGGIGDAIQNVWERPPVSYLGGYVDGPGDRPDLSSEEAFRSFIDGQSEAYCSTSARFRWTARYTYPELDGIFRRVDGLPRIGHVLALNVLGRSPGGRVQTLEIVGTEGRAEVHKDAIRWLWSGGHVGTGGLQSTLFYIDSDANGVTLHGGGWGHGVGMCQEGAGGMARAGFDWKAIIEHY